MTQGASSGVECVGYLVHVRDFVYLAAVIRAISTPLHHILWQAVGSAKKEDAPTGGKDASAKIQDRGTWALFDSTFEL